MKFQAQNTTFKYPGPTTSMLANTNLTTEPGESLAVVGHNESGESYRLESGPRLPLTASAS